MITPAAISFSDCIRDLCNELPGFSFDSSSAEPFASLNYETECRIKNLALKHFWKQNGIPGVLQPMIPAVQPRHYRTNSKRRGVFANGKFQLLHPGHSVQAEVRGNLQYSMLEPELHHRIYELILEMVSRPPFRFFARNLNYCIVRGSDRRAAVILNLAKIDASIVRKLKIIASELQQEIPEVISCFMYLDETRSEYYLESRRPEKGVPFKKLCGTAMLDITIRNRKFLYPPTVFSQINEAMLPLMVNEAFRLLKPDPDRRFLDLYCGYGLFGLLAAEHSAEVIGMDAEGPAIEAASANAVYHFPGRKIKFIASSITGESLERHLPRTEKRGGGEIAVLDPPRKGTAPGVLERLVARRPFRVLHIFCGTDMLANGYSPVAAVPLDLFPGTMNLETLVLLERKRS